MTPWSDKKNSFLIPLPLFLFVFKSIFDSNNAVNFQTRCQINLTFIEPRLRMKMYLFQEFDLFLAPWRRKFAISCLGSIFRSGLSPFYLAIVATLNPRRLSIWRQQVKSTATPPHVLKTLSFQNNFDW